MTRSTDPSVQTVTQAEIDARIAEAHRLRAETLASGLSAIGRAFARLLHPRRTRTA